MTDEEWKREKELRKQDRIKARREEWEKVRSLGWAARLQYFWDYYKIVLVIAAVVLFLIYLGRTMYVGFHTDTIFYAAMLNPDALDTEADRLGEDFAEYIGGLEKNQALVIDTSLSITPGSYSQQDVAAVMKMTAYVQAGQLDVMVGPARQIAFEQSEGVFLPLDDMLSGEQIRKLDQTGDLFYAKEPVLPAMGGSETESTEWELPNLFEGEAQKPFEMNTVRGEDQHIYAVRVDDAGILGNYNIYGDEDIWLAMVGSTKRTDRVKEFLSFLRGEKAL